MISQRKALLIGFDASRAFVNEATGTENYSLNLLRALARVDGKNHYKVYLRNLPTTSYKLLTKNWPANFEFRTIGPSRLWTQVGLALETWRAPVDLLFVPAHTLPILRNPQVKTLVTIHDLGVEYLPGFHQFPQRYYLDFASRYAASHADGVIAVSEATKADLIKRYKIDSKKIFVVHEGVDMSFFKPQSKSKVASVKSKYKIKRPYILFVGTIQPRKNLEFLIRVFSYLIGKTNIDLVIAGKLGWDFREIIEAPKKYGIGGQVKFIGRVDDSDLPALYSSASVFAFPSLFEGFGLPILEALACGCPVVASNIPAHRELYNHLKSEFSPAEAGSNNNRFVSVPMILAKPDDTQSWIKFLYQYISQYEKKSDLYNKNSKFLANYSWSEAAKKTVAVFERILS